MIGNDDYQEALFWCNLLHPLIFEELGGESPRSYFVRRSQEDIMLLDGSIGRVSLATLKRKWLQYRTGGLEALMRKKRSDSGAVRVVPEEILAKAVEIKKEQPLRSDEAINLILKEMYGKSIARSTLYRHLKQSGATRLRLGATREKVRKRWTRDYSNALWCGDFSHGPYVLKDGESHPTRLCIFIDVYSRYVVQARYYSNEKLDILIDLLLRAWSCHGRSDEIYVDNGKVFHSKALKAACYELGINLLHRPPRDPAAGGIIERVILSVQSQLESEVRAGHILTLDQLNRALSAYLEVSYHQRIHSETQQSPAERYRLGLKAQRPVDLNAACRFFMRKEQRCVEPNFSDIRMENRYYRVDPKLRGEKVIVRWDPFGSLEKVLIYSMREEYLGTGELYQREKGAQTDSYVPAVPKHNYLEILVKQHDLSLRTQAEGIDYRKLTSTSFWPYNSFIQCMARLLGRKGGTSAFTTDEHEQLHQIHQRYPHLNEPMLMLAAENAQHKTIAHIAYELQRLAAYQGESR